MQKEKKKKYSGSDKMPTKQVLSSKKAGKMKSRLRLFGFYLLSY